MRIPGLLVCILALALGPAAAKRNPAAELNENDLWRQTFEVVWTTVKDKHFDPTFGGVDWDAVKARYAPRVEAAASEAELYKLLQQMLAELGQSHFNIYPPASAPAAEAEREAPTGDAGIEITIDGKRALVTRIEKGSPAERAGIKPGFIIEQIDDTAVQTILERFKPGLSAESMADVYRIREVESRISGRAGSHVKLVYLDAQDRRQSAELLREPWRGEFSAPFANMPPQRIEFESRRLESGVGYIRFNIFMPSMMERIRTAIRSYRDAPGLIIDLRGNPGGLGAMSSGMAGLLCSTQGSLGRMQMRTGFMNFAVYPQSNPYTGAVGILIDRRSASTSEVFAAGMQELGRAVVVGEPSAGAALPSIFTKLPTGAMFQFAMADFKTPKGALIEGRGVVPDLIVKPDRESLLRGRDNQLEAALAALGKSKREAAK